MRTTINLQDELLEEARELTGVHGKTELLHRGLRALVREAARERLARLGGSDPQVSAAPRRRTALSSKRHRGHG